jgi:D-glycero-alpha-D-manno-heptose-7-phosphate kinase
MTDGLRINAAAPIRICDIGGWTDTWFAEHGNVLNMAVDPHVEVQIEVSPRTHDERIHIHLENFNAVYSLNPERIVFDKHPLIEAAIDLMEIPQDVEFMVNIYSAAPPGASTGTSAAVSVALVAALDRLTPGRLTAHEIASLAHHIETEKLGLQSGIQDQLCSCYGGISYIGMHRYPNASVSPVLVSESTWWELENRLLLVYIGTPHSSSTIHKAVIKGLGANASADARLEELRSLAGEAKNALLTADFDRLGDIMNRNTRVQQRLHVDLVCEKFLRIMEMGERYKAIGYKVNGAGGDGGSMTILMNGDKRLNRAFARDLVLNGFSVIDIHLDRHGIRVW